jgi:predicted alpha-1,2-mannosidase
MFIANRRQLLAGAGLTALASATPGLAGTQGVGATKPDLFIGTGGHGHTFPGPSLPFGMVQLGPDTDNSRWDACSGYHRTDGSIMGFSHTHLSGTGIGDMLDVLVVPTRGPLELDPGKLDDPDKGYRQRFSEEHAEPGYYRVKLESGVLAELTVTERTGLHRYHFPQGPGHILIDFAHMILDVWDKGTIVDQASLAFDGRTGMLTGSRRVHRWAKGRHIHFAMQLSRSPSRVQFFGDDNKPAGGNTGAILGNKLKAVLFFDEAGGDPILIKTGISAIDVAGAKAALTAEAPGWDFDRAATAARSAWAKELDCVRVEGGTPAQRTIMASALYHCFLAPTLFTDSDGRYLGMDRQVHQAPADTPAFSTYSLWDTYRALHPLLTLVQPERAAMFTRDLIRQTQQSPYGPPVWQLQGVETGCMIGWHSVSVLAEAKAKGIEADYAAAWPNIRRRAFDRTFKDSDGSLGRGYYYDLDYIPADKIWESVSRTQEYAYDDWAMAVLADAAGAKEDAAALRKRSRNYRNVLDPETRFARPKFSDGSWWAPYDPVQIGHDVKKHRDYTEANGWQATFLNQHDVYGLIAHFGGDASFEKQLDALFNAPSVLPENAPPDISGLVGQYAHGNEPNHHVAYLYAYAGAPWKTQAMIRRLCTEMYKAEPDGEIGNDDCGQMSAWFVLSALGFYPVDPVSAVYVLGSPLFDRAEMRLGRGKVLRVIAEGNAPDAPYVQSVRWNGRPWTRNWISHADLAKGGELEFVMGRKPSRFGAAKADRPPSFGRTPA